MVTPHNNSGGVCPQKQITEQVPCSHTAWSHTQPRKSCCLCRELLPCCKEEAGASGKLPPRWSCTLLLLFCLLGTHAGFLQVQPPSEFKAGCLNTVPGCFPFTHEGMWDQGPHEKHQTHRQVTHLVAKMGIGTFFSYSCCLQRLCGSWCCRTQVALLYR